MAFVWSTGQTPTISDNKTEDGTGAGWFTSSIADLEPNTTYYLRAYATNSAGTGYGSAMSFTTQQEPIMSSFTDSRDGKVYQTVVIGNQVWMAENLAYAPSSGNYWAYDNDDANVETYGYLYDWETALDVCPTGWHLASDYEWTKLVSYLGDNASGKLKATGTIEAGTGLWEDPNYRATNESGFAALPGGARNYEGEFFGIGYMGCWWTDTQSAGGAWLYWITNDQYYVARNYNHRDYGCSVRCVKD